MNRAVAYVNLKAIATLQMILIPYLPWLVDICSVELLLRDAARLSTTGWVNIHVLIS